MLDGADGSEGDNYYAAELNIKNLSIDINAIDNNVHGNYGIGGAGAIVSNIYSSNSNPSNHDTFINFENSDVNINFQTDKYVSGQGAAILLVASKSIRDQSFVNSQASNIIIHSSLGGIFLTNLSMSFKDSYVEIKAGEDVQNPNFSISDASYASGLLLKGYDFDNSKNEKEYQYRFVGQRLSIEGANGIQIEQGTIYDVNDAKLKLVLDNKMGSDISAIDSHGKIKNTSALIAVNKHDHDDCLASLAGEVNFINHQTASENITEKNGLSFYGLNLNHYDIQTVDSVHQNTQTSINISVSANDFKNSVNLYGTYSVGSILQFDHPITATVMGNDKDFVEAFHLDSGQLKSSKQIQLTATEGSQLGTAILAKNSSYVVLNSLDRTDNAKSFIYGNITVDESSGLEIKQVNPFILIGGITAHQDKSSIELNNSKSKWFVTDNSELGKLVLDGSLLSFDPQEASSVIQANNIVLGNEHHQLELGSLTLSNDARLNLRVNLSGETTLTDTIRAQKVDGTGIADIKLVGSVTEHKAMSEGVGFLYQDEGTLTLQLPDRNNDGTPDQVIYQNGGIMGWKLAYQATEQENTEAEQAQIDLPEMTDGAVTGTGKGYWYLTTGDYAELPDEPDPTPEPTPDPDPLPPEAQQIQNLGSSVAQAVGWLSEKNDLRRRLGEVRYGTQTGAWAKVFNRQDRAQGFRYNGFKQESTGVHIGYDTFVNQTAEASWLIGATLRYAHSKQEGLETAYGGDGKLNEYSAKVYATWLHQSGAYMDVLAQIGYYDQEINGLNNSAEAVFDANYHNWGMGVSAEIGHKLPLGPQGQSNTWTSNWFIEPQLELSYFYVKGDDFTTSTGLKVNQGNADFLTGRLGFVLGKKVSYGPSEAVDKRWYQFGLIGGMNHEFLGDQTIRFTGVDGAVADVKGHGLGGTSFYYGITADWQVSDKLRIYGELDREEGDHYTKDYGINVGIKYAF